MVDMRTCQPLMYNDIKIWAILTYLALSNIHDVSECRCCPNGIVKQLNGCLAAEDYSLNI